MSVQEFDSIPEAKPEPKPETQVLLLSGCKIYEPKAITQITCACAETCACVTFAGHKFHATPAGTCNTISF